MVLILLVATITSDSGEFDDGVRIRGGKSERQICNASLSLNLSDSHL